MNTIVSVRTDHEDIDKAQFEDIVAPAAYLCPLQVMEARSSVASENKV